MEQQRLTPLQAWIKWRLIVSTVMLTVVLIWTAFRGVDFVVMGIVAGIAIVARFGTDCYLFLRRRRERRPINPPNRIQTAHRNQTDP